MELLVVMGAHPHLFDGEDVTHVPLRVRARGCKEHGTEEVLAVPAALAVAAGGTAAGKALVDYFVSKQADLPQNAGPRRGAGHCAGDLVGGAGDGAGEVSRVGGAGDLVAAGDRVGAGKCRVSEVRETAAEQGSVASEVRETRRRRRDLRVGAR